MTASTTLTELQDWYRSQCNDDWEHSCGVKIETLDNPGWSVTVDLTETELQDRVFKPVVRGPIAYDLNQDQDWIVCKVEGQSFQGAGGPAKLEEIIATFLTWAKSGA